MKPKISGIIYIIIFCWPGSPPGAAVGVIFCIQNWLAIMISGRMWRGSDSGCERSVTHSQFAATSVNDRGEVVGTAQSPEDGTLHTFLWTRDKGMQDLGAFPGAIVTVAPCCNTINDRGEVVGFSIDGTTFSSRALLWKDKVMTDLNTLIPADSGWYLQAAYSINYAGEIVGYGTVNSTAVAVVAKRRGSLCGECG